MNYLSFAWPKTDDEIDRLMVGAFLHAIKSLSMTVGPRLQEAMTLAENVVSGFGNDKDREEALVRAWEWLRQDDRIGDFRTKEALEVRLSLFLLDKPSSSKDERLDNLTWFSEFIRAIGGNVSFAEKAIDDFYENYEKVGVVGMPGIP